MKDDLLFYLSFSHFDGIGPVRLRLLKKYFGSIKKAYIANHQELSKIIGANLSEKFISFRSKFDPVKKFNEIKKKEIIILTIDDKHYPTPLKNISDPPICIYIKGSVKVLSSSLMFSIVGTRNPTTYGIEITKKFTNELVNAGFVIVSGLAYGIDTAAHRSCLNVKGKTVAVLGCGVDIAYPAANRQLYEEIVRLQGAVVSEFPPGKTVIKSFFIARNRIISGLSSGVMVVEGGKNSGSLITARYAAEQGRDVYAVPNPITSEMSIAPNTLLKHGAKLVMGIEDIIDEY